MKVLLLLLFTLAFGVEDYTVTTDESEFGVKVEPTVMRAEKVEFNDENSYVSPEVLAQREYKYYNNTYLYISIRDQFLGDGDKGGEVRKLYNNLIRPALKGKGLKGFKLKKVFDSHLQVAMADLEDIKPAVRVLKELHEILAIEWLMKKNVFGVKATIKEMAKFRPKIKK